MSTKQLVTQLTGKPTRKVKAAGIGGLVTAICVAVVNHYLPGMGEQLGPEVATVIVGALTAVGATVGGWFAKDEKQQATPG